LIIHHGRRWVYLGIPKTASTALHRYLPTRGAESWAHQHEMAIPPECAGYFVFATSRNPFRRAWSLWRMLGNDRKKGASWALEAPERFAQSFRAYVLEMLQDPEPTLPVYQHTMCRWLEGVPPGFDVTVVHSEQLDRELRRLGVLGPGESVPVKNRTRPGDGPRWLEAYDAELEQAVRRWAREDFRRFGYADALAVWRRRERVEGALEGLRALPRRTRQRLGTLRRRLLG
jgi:hypothetical protein